MQSASNSYLIKQGRVVVSKASFFFLLFFLPFFFLFVFFFFPVSLFLFPFFPLFLSSFSLFPIFFLFPLFLLFFFPPFPFFFSPLCAVSAIAAYSHNLKLLLQSLTGLSTRCASFRVLLTLCTEQRTKVQTTASTEPLGTWCRSSPAAVRKRS